MMIIHECTQLIPIPSCSFPVAATRIPEVRIAPEFQATPMIPDMLACFFGVNVVM
jgi:hypothetical protein